MSKALFDRQRWWLARVAALPFQMIVFALVVFVLLRAIPGDPVELVTGGQYTPEIYARVQHSLGLDGSLLEQLARYLRNLVSLDFGTSLVSGRPIAADIAQKLPETIELALMALVGTIIVTLLGSYAVVMRPRNFLSRLLAAYARTAGAIPEFVIGIAAIFIFYATLHWAPPPMGRLSPYLDPPPTITGMPFADAILSWDGEAIASTAAHLVLPVGVMILAQAPILMKILIAELGAAIEAPATRFRIATGASRLTVLASIYRRALPPTVTMLGSLFGYLVGGAIIIETLFGLDGMGEYAIDAVLSADLTTVQSVLLVIAGLALLVFMLTDLANMALDPRRRPGSRTES